MRSDLAFSRGGGVLLLLLGVLSRRLCRGGKPTPAATKPLRAKRVPKPFAGLTGKPDYPVCEQKAESAPSAAAPHTPPPRMSVPRGRQRHGETTGHFCPHAACAYHGWVAWGICVPMAIPTVDGGDRSSVWAAAAISWRPMARRCTASRCSQPSWCGRSRRGRQGSVSVP
jgi:hypothetical protein